MSLAQVAADPIAIAGAIDTLRKRNMARISPGSIQMHRIPAALLRSRTRDQQHNGQNWAVIAVHLLRCADLKDPWMNPSAWPLWQALLPHVLVATAAGRPLDAVASEVSWLLRNAGVYFHTRGSRVQPLRILNAPTSSLRQTTMYATALRRRSTTRPACAPSTERKMPYT